MPENCCCTHTHTNLTDGYVVHDFSGLAPGILSTAKQGCMEGLKGSVLVDRGVFIIIIIV